MGLGAWGSRVRHAGLSAQGCIRYSGVRWVCMVRQIAEVRLVFRAEDGVQG